MFRGIPSTGLSLEEYGGAETRSWIASLNGKLRWLHELAS